MFELWGMHFEAVLLSVPTLDISLTVSMVTSG